MKKHLLIIVTVALSAYGRTFAQNDTTYSYLDSNSNSTDMLTAYKIEVFQAGNLWHKQTIKIADAKLLYDECYSDKSLKTREDTSKDYCYYEHLDNPASEKDVIFEDIYQQGKLLKTQAVDTLKGKLVGYAIYANEGKVIKQKDYDENGNEIPNYILKQEAGFPGGTVAWQRYLIKNLQETVPVDNGAPSGRYSVVVSFSIDENGNIINIKALSDPGYGTAEEGVRVISKSGKWVPAIYFNKRVVSRQKQRIIFTVEVVSH